MGSDRNELPAFVELLEECIRTFEELEVVLILLRRSGRSSTVERLVADVGLPATNVASAVDRLRKVGLIRPGDETIELDTRDPRRMRGLAELQAEYATNRTRVMSLMTANALRRVRTSAIQAFARAFLLGKKHDG
jgi:hypothetical protein